MKCPKCGASEKDLVFVTKVEGFNSIKDGKVTDEHKEDTITDYRVECRVCDTAFAVDVDEKTKKVSVKGK